MIVAETLCSSCTKAFMCCQKAFGSFITLAELCMQTLQCVETHSVGVSPRVLPESCRGVGVAPRTHGVPSPAAPGILPHPSRGFPQQDLQSWLIQPRLCTCYRMQECSSQAGFLAKLFSQLCIWVNYEICISFTELQRTKAPFQEES